MTREGKPNIVLMVSDDLGREAVGCYGNPVIKTPSLDALAAGGVRFVNSFCTAPTCSASRTTILTGQQNHTTGTYGLTHGYNHFSCFPTVTTLPALLRGKYRTGRVGKQHYQPVAMFPFDWGHPDGKFGRDDVRMSEACREFIRGDEPFFLYWCSMNPHRADFVESHPLRPNSFGNPAQAFPGDAEQLYAESEVIIPPFLNDMPEVRAELAQYYQSISRLDRGAGRLFKILEEEGKAENTIIIFVSDNGPAFPEAKTTMYDPGLRLPCIVRSPFHRARGTTCDGLITWADITPTILDFAGLYTDSAAFFGRSFAGILDQTSPADWRNEIFAAHTFHEITNYYPARVVRTRRHKFIWNIAWKLDYPFASDLWHSASWQAVLRNKQNKFGARSVDAYIHRPRFELYDLEMDPDETVNLADEPHCQKLVREFCDKIKIFQKDTRDPWLHKLTYE